MLTRGGTGVARTGDALQDHFEVERLARERRLLAGNGPNELGVCLD